MPTISKAICGVPVSCRDALIRDARIATRCERRAREIGIAYAAQATLNPKQSDVPADKSEIPLSVCESIEVYPLNRCFGVISAVVGERVRQLAQHSH